MHLVKLFVIIIVCALVLHWVKGVQDEQGIKGIYSTALARVSANFALGCVAFVLSPRIRNLVWLGTLAAAGAATCATFHLDEGFSLCFMLLIIGLSYDRDWLSPILSGRVMVYLGETSFALYMVHVFVWEAVAAIATKLHLLRMPGVFVVIPVALLSAFIASAVVFRFVEVPAREFIRGHGTRRGKVVSTHS